MGCFPKRYIIIKKKHLYLTGEPFEKMYALCYP